MNSMSTADTPDESAKPLRLRGGCIPCPGERKPQKQVRHFPDYPSVDGGCCFVRVAKRSCNRPRTDARFLLHVVYSTSLLLLSGGFQDPFELRSGIGLLHTLALICMHSYVWRRSGYYTVFFETKIVHCFVDRFFNFLPVTSPLNKLVHVLHGYLLAMVLTMRLYVTSQMRTSGRKLPPYLVTSRTICTRSFASSTMYTCPSILRFAKSAAIFGTRNELMNA